LYWASVVAKGESMVMVSTVAAAGPRTLSGSVVVVAAGVAALAVSVTDTAGFSVTEAVPGVDEPAVTVAPKAVLQL
jgi:hypothetical protein